MTDHAEMFFRDMTDEMFDEFFDRDRYLFFRFSDFVFVDEGDDLFVVVVIGDVGFREAGAFGISADVASSVGGIGEFFADEDIPDDLVKEFCDGEEIRGMVFFLPEGLQRARDREGFFFQLFADPLSEEFNEDILKAIFQGSFGEEGAVFP